MQSRIRGKMQSRLKGKTRERNEESVILGLSQGHSFYSTASRLQLSRSLTNHLIYLLDEYEQAKQFVVETGVTSDDEEEFDILDETEFDALNLDSDGDGWNSSSDVRVCV